MMVSRNSAQPNIAASENGVSRPTARCVGAIPVSVPMADDENALGDTAATWRPTGPATEAPASGTKLPNEAVAVTDDTRMKRTRARTVPAGPGGNGDNRAPSRAQRQAITWENSAIAVEANHSQSMAKTAAPIRTTKSLSIWRCCHAPRRS